MTKSGSEALARLGVFVGEWVLDARFPGDQQAPSNAREDGPQVRSRFEWALGGQFLKSGYMDKHVLHETTDGTPQGGIITPLTQKVISNLRG